VKKPEKGKKMSKPRAKKPRAMRKAPQQPATLPTPQPGAPKVFLISEALVSDILKYVQNVPSGNMTGGVVIQLFAGLQQLPEVQGDGKGTFYVKPQVPQGMPAAPAPAPAPAPALASVPDPDEDAE
jgi:hypothetical protein